MHTLYRIYEVCHRQVIGAGEPLDRRIPIFGSTYWEASLHSVVYLEDWISFIIRQLKMDGGCHCGESQTCFTRNQRMFQYSQRHLYKGGFHRIPNSIHTKKLALGTPNMNHMKVVIVKDFEYESLAFVAELHKG